MRGCEHLVMTLTCSSSCPLSLSAFRSPNPLFPLPPPPLLSSADAALHGGCSETLSEANDMARGKIAVMAHFRYVHLLARLCLSCFYCVFLLSLAAAQRAEMKGWGA